MKPNKRVLDWDDEIEDVSEDEYITCYGKPSYPDEEADWNAWRDEELALEAMREEKEKLKNEQ
ncbi:MAG TPA: hypothetical protein DDW18_05130 [Firmicutes bacterium]|nr:hypothetical protein [Bacillota bacterium]